MVPRITWAPRVALSTGVQPKAAVGGLRTADRRIGP